MENSIFIDLLASTYLNKEVIKRTNTYSNLKKFNKFIIKFKTHSNQFIQTHKLQSK